MVKSGELAVNLTARQKRVINALLTERTIGAACESAGVGRTTLARWLTLDLFNNALRTEQEKTTRRANWLLIGAQEKAINVLLTLAESARNEATKRAAAVDLLTFSLKFNEAIDFENRLTALEKAKFNDKK